MKPGPSCGCGPVLHPAAFLRRLSGRRCMACRAIPGHQAPATGSPASAFAYGGGYAVTSVTGLHRRPMRYGALPPEGFPLDGTTFFCSVQYGEGYITG
jgi:hypothetical protein